MRQNKRLALILGLVLISGCGGTQQLAPDIPRQKPVAAMEPEPRLLCTLKPEFDNMTREDQAALVDNCHALDSEQYRRLERKFLSLVDWINNQ